MFVAVHAGAGLHPLDHKSHIKHALQLLLDSLPSLSPLDAVEQAISLLEDNPAFNAGCGSNLTIDGAVECDAAIIDHHLNFGSVGALPGCKNPIKVARAVLDYSTQSHPLNRVPPLTLVSAGARTFAQSRGLSHLLVSPESLVSPDALRRWNKWKSRLDLPPDDESDVIQDTVGAVALSDQLDAAAGVSSGGILLKLPGRIGEAAIYGAGCWAQVSHGVAFACSVSGSGELITRVALAKYIGERLENSLATGDADMHEILQRSLVDHFWTPSMLRGDPHPNVGVLVIMSNSAPGQDTNSVRVWCAFTTRTMAIGYVSSRRPRPRAMILRRPNSMNEDVPIFITAFTL